jgi:hypothetical protein
VQFKFGGMEKHFIYLFLFLFVSFYLSFCAKKFEKKKRKLCYVLVKFELNCDCYLNFIDLLKGLNTSLC